jgi:hypothetical protein
MGIDEEMEGLESRSCLGFWVDIVANVRRMGMLAHFRSVVLSDMRSECFAIDAIVLWVENGMSGQCLTMTCSSSLDLEVWLELAAGGAETCINSI